MSFSTGGWQRDIGRVVARVEDKMRRTVLPMMEGRETVTLLRGERRTPIIIGNTSMDRSIITSGGWIKSRSTGVESPSLSVESVR